MGHFSVKILAQEGQFSVALNIQENDCWKISGSQCPLWLLGRHVRQWLCPSNSPC